MKPEMTYNAYSGYLRWEDDYDEIKTDKGFVLEERVKENNSKQKVKVSSKNT